MVIYLQKKVKNVMYYSLLFLCIVVVYFVSNTFVFMRFDDREEMNNILNNMNGHISVILDF